MKEMIGNVVMWGVESQGLAVLRVSSVVQAVAEVSLLQESRLSAQDCLVFSALMEWVASRMREKVSWKNPPFGFGVEDLSWRPMHLLLSLSVA
jgi:hypothetical protein